MENKITKQSFIFVTKDEAKGILEYSGKGENDKLISLTFENGEIKAVIDLAPNKFNLPSEDTAVSMYSQASENINDRTC